ncbi:MAG: hypothetical protein V3V05_05425 [Pontiella sp.]
MNISETMKMTGNRNRMSELQNAGFGYSAIAGVFQDNGIELSPETVKDMLNSELTKKALSKAAVKELINAGEELDYSLGALPVL